MDRFEEVPDENSDVRPDASDTNDTDDHLNGSIFKVLTKMQIKKIIDQEIDDVKTVAMVSILCAFSSILCNKFIFFQNFSVKCVFFCCIAIY